MTETKYYVTKQGLQKIEKDYQKLLEFRKKKTTDEEVPSIWHSEEVNPDYLAFQEDMSLLEAKLAEFELMLKNVELIKLPPKEKRSEVYLGATITLEEVPGREINEYTLLGTMEANPAEGRISTDSPVGRTLLGKKLGEEVVISSPIRVVYRIKKISYLAF
ncbi:GreA/GreB family elongation factor [Patescibacteria group bacterium]|nr:GreA/GreB family elongation factor [Patescibacteria group bacterium]